jgi:hypothetical protein
MILGTGFEGQLMAAGATVLFFAVVIGAISWFVLWNWGPLKSKRETE